MCLLPALVLRLIDVKSGSLPLSWPFHDGPQEHAEVPTASSIFHAEKKQKGTCPSTYILPCVVCSRV